MISTGASRSDLRAGIYVRISRLSATNEDSTERQEERCRAYCEAQGWRVVDVFRDEGISGFKDVERRGWRKLEGAILAGAVDVVVVFAISRAGRSAYRLAAFIEEVCRPAGVAFASATDGVDTTTPMGPVLFHLFAALAEAESRTKSERLLSKNLAQAAAGEYHGGQVPFGYDVKNGVVRVNNGEAAVVRQMAQAVIAHQSLYSIAKDLNRRGIETKRGKRWSGSTVKQLLSSPFLIGRRSHLGEDVAAGTWKPIIDIATTKAMQAVFAENERRYTRHGRDPGYVLTGIAVCGTCGDGLTGGGKPNGPKSRRYICPDGHHVSIRANQFEEWVLWQASWHRPALAVVVEEPGAHQVAYMAKRIELDTRRKQARRAYAEGELDVETLTGVTAAIQEKLDELDREFEIEMRRAAPTLPTDDRSRLEMLVDKIIVAEIAANQNKRPVEERCEVVLRDGVTELTERPERPRQEKPKREPKVCQHEENGVRCGRPATYTGGRTKLVDFPVCPMHYMRVVNTGELGPVAPLGVDGPRPKNPCSVGWCIDEVHSRTWCRRHYNEWYRTGKPPSAIPPAGSPVLRQQRRPRKTASA